jgi:TRAP-type transport system periplasmic protein
MYFPRNFTRRTLRISAFAAATLLLPGIALADQTFKLTIAASHPTTVPWVGLLNTFFVPEVTKRVTALNKGYKIEWREAYGGQLYKINATLSSVSQGITDIGWVFHNLEPARLPLQQFGTVAPFTTDDVSVILDVVNEMNANLPALKNEWEVNNAVFLGGTAVDTYHLFTKQPVKAYADLSGRKLSAPGAVGLWLRGSGAVAVDGALTTYYTDMQSGLSEGGLSIATGILPNKIYEVAPYITKVSMGSLYGGALAINKDVYDGMPADVQQIVRAVGLEYSRKLGETLMERYESALKKMVELGANQSPPVTITTLPEDERKKWARTMPNLAAEWVKANATKGPTKEIMQKYMDALRKRGVKPLRDWDKEL